MTSAVRISGDNITVTGCMIFSTNTGAGIQIEHNVAGTVIVDSEIYCGQFTLWFWLKMWWRFRK